MTMSSVSSGQSLPNLVISGGEILTVSNGGTITTASILNGGSAIILSGGFDSGSTIQAGGTETVSGQVTGDAIYGTQILNYSGATAASTAAGETVYNGGVLDLYIAAAVATGTTIAAGGTMNISGHAVASNTTLETGALLTMQSPKAVLSGTVEFDGAATIAVEGVISAGYGGTAALITGFATGDVIDFTSIAGGTLTVTTSGGNEIATITGAAYPDVFTFAGTGLALTTAVDAAGSGTDIIVAPVTTITAGNTTTPGYVVSAGAILDVLAGGTAAGIQVAAGGIALIHGADIASTIAAGGAETIFNTASLDLVLGVQTVSGAVTGGTIGAGGLVTLSGAATAAGLTISGGALDLGGTSTATNLVINGGEILLSGTGQTLAGGLTFAGPGTILETGILAPGGNAAIISGFVAGDVIDLAAIGAGATLTSATVNGDTVLTISGGSTQGTASESFTLASTGGTYALTPDLGTGEDLAQSGAAIPALTSFTAGDLVISVVGGDVDGVQAGDNQATPIVLEEIDPATGAIVGEMALPQTASGANSAISGEYGSSSEGILQLAGNGQSLVIAGYGINAATFNNGGAAVYGTTALAQTTSLQGGQYTPVARVVADISYNGNVDTSTAIYGIFNLNNPRSVATIDGSVFYLSGQGNKDGTQGIFVADDGAGSATAIDTATDTRTAEIYNGNLYVSQNSSDGTGNIEEFNGLPAGAATPAILSGLDFSVVLTAAQENVLNAGAVGTAVDLSPEQYFFANATTLYVADGGQPKAGTIGDGGLQKWTLDPSTGVWTLAYTLSAGLNLVQNGAVSTDTAGTTGLIGLTGVLNANGTVTFYATNSTIGDLDQTYLYTITDNVAATTAAAGESFSVVETAAAGTNIRGIALAPSAPTDVTILNGQISAGISVTNGSQLTVNAGGHVSGAVILSGGNAYVSGTDTGSLIVEGGAETIYGSAAQDNVYGMQVVSGGVSFETVYDYGEIGIGENATASNTTINAGGALDIAALGTATNAVIDGGAVLLQWDSSVLAGNVTLAGAGTIIEAQNPASGGGLTAVISGFTAADAIDFTQIAPGATLTSAVAGANTVFTISGGGVATTVTLAGQYTPNDFQLLPDTGSGTILAIAPATDTGSSTVSAGFTSEEISIAAGASVTVAAGGSLIAAIILAAGSAAIAGSETNTTIQAGGSETISGHSTGDTVAGTQLVISGASVSNETISGGALTISGNTSVDNLTVTGGGVVYLDSPKAAIGGSLDFTGPGTIIAAAIASAGYGGNAVISGFAAGDQILITPFTGAATLTSATVGGNTVETVTSGGVSESFTFTGTGYDSSYFVLSATAAGAELVVSASPTLTIANGQIAPLGYIVSNGFAIDVLSGGAATGVTVLSGGNAYIAGTDTALTIAAGGSATLLSGGTETAALILAGGTATYSAGTATGDQVYGTQNIISGAGVTLTGETVFAGGLVDILIKGNFLENSTLLTGALLNISGNSEGENLTIAGGTINLESPKANLTGALVFAGAGTLAETDVISAGVGGDFAVISGFAAGDVIDLSALGTGATLTSAFTGGDTVLSIAGGAAEGTEVETFTFAGSYVPGYFDFNGTDITAALVVSAGATGANIVVSAGETLLVYGTVDGTTLQAGGTEIIYTGGVDGGGTIITGGAETVTSGATVYITAAATPGLTVEAGATEIIAPGVTVKKTKIAGGVTLDVQGRTSGAVLSAGATEIIASGGVDSGTTIKSGGAETVQSGGLVYLTSAGTAAVTILPGGTEAVGSGLTLKDLTIGNGVTLHVRGTVNLTTVDGGKENVYANAKDHGGTVENGGMEFIYSAGNVNGAIIGSGSVLTVYSGGLVTGGLTLSGGEALISGTMAKSQKLSFTAPGGVLDLANPAGFAAAISGFATGDTLDLSTLTYTTGESFAFKEAASQTSGTLTLSAGAATEKLKLLGSYVTSDFVVSAGGTGGTLVKFS